MKQKRAPGGGRKPRGPFKENRARLSLRVTPDVRRALVAWAKARKLSLSQAAQSHLQKSLSRFFHPRPDIIVLTEMIARVIQDVERTTEAEWGQSINFLLTLMNPVNGSTTEPFSAILAPA
jgi:hypothetical protein